MTQFMGHGGKGVSFPRLCALVRRWLSFQWEIRESEIQDKRPQSLSTFQKHKTLHYTPPTPSSLRVGGGPTEETNAQIHCHQRISTTHLIIGQDLSWVFKKLPIRVRILSGFDCMGHLHPLPLTPLCSGSCDFQLPMSTLCGGLTHEI